MKLMLAAGMLAGILVAGLPMVQGQTPDARQYDFDGDGYVTILDIAAVANHYGQQVGTPEPCIEWVGYATPLTSYDADGTPVISAGGYYRAPADSVWGKTIIAGGATDARVCP